MNILFYFLSKNIVCVPGVKTIKFVFSCWRHLGKKVRLFPLGKLIWVGLIFVSMTGGLYYKHITIINGNSRAVRMMLQVVASPTIVILMTLLVSFMLLENIYSTGVTHDDCNDIYGTGHRVHIHKISYKILQFNNLNAIH
jgi:hypothetical protein